MTYFLFYVYLKSYFCYIYQNKLFDELHNSSIIVAHLEEKMEYWGLFIGHWYETLLVAVDMCYIGAS